MRHRWSRPSRLEVSPALEKGCLKLLAFSACWRLSLGAGWWCGSSAGWALGLYGQGRRDQGSSCLNLR